MDLPLQIKEYIRIHEYMEVVLKHRFISINHEWLVHLSINLSIFAIPLDENKTINNNDDIIHPKLSLSRLYSLCQILQASVYQYASDVSPTCFYISRSGRTFNVGNVISVARDKSYDIHWGNIFWGTLSVGPLIETLTQPLRPSIRLAEASDKRWSVHFIRFAFTKSPTNSWQINIENQDEAFFPRLLHNVTIIIFGSA